MRHILTVVLILLITSTAFSQTQPTTGSAADTSNTAALNKSGQPGIALEPDTQLAAQLQSTLDVRKAKIGDQIVLKTTDAIKSADGQTLLKKGARLVGRITQARQKTKEINGSSISLVFERLENGPQAMPITAAINYIAPARPPQRNTDEDLPDPDGSTRKGGIARSQQSPVANQRGLTGGGVGTESNVLDTTTGTSGVMYDAEGRTMGSLRIMPSTDAGAAGSTTLTLAGSNLRLEKGSTFRLTLNRAAEVAGNQ